METITSPVQNDSDNDEDFFPKKAINNYRKLLDSDSSEDENVNRNSNVTRKEESDDEESDSDGEKNVNKSRIKPQLDSSDDENEDEEEEEMAQAAVKDRRKNSNPKKKILPVKTQRVRKQNISSIKLLTKLLNYYRNQHQRQWKLSKTKCHTNSKLT
jgi:hypothetical protein